MQSKAIFEIIRGGNGVGSWNLNRRFVYEFGLLPSLLIADLARAHLYALKIHTNIGDYFLWNPTSFRIATHLTKKQLHQCLDLLLEHDVWETRKINDSIYMKVNWYVLKELNQPVSWSEYNDE